MMSEKDYWDLKAALEHIQRLASNALNEIVYARPEPKRKSSRKSQLKRKKKKKRP